MIHLVEWPFIRRVPQSFETVSYKRVFKKETYLVQVTYGKQVFWLFWYRRSSIKHFSRCLSVCSPMQGYIIIELQNSKIKIQNFKFSDYQISYLSRQWKLNWLELSCYDMIRRTKTQRLPKKIWTWWSTTG